ncbi:NAD-dependent protein deacylase [Singulisphaera sp. GP187]|uniref:NAD-dependent protein deacylase n=1 Tax=Singulisphaera sp. GP187 TaxID=1882752 RepID=UPI00094109B9|nr:NAD-dependent protein deacylase [Singulisphaera sp. GP187]
MTLTEADSQVIDQVVGLLRPDRRLLFITGAGLSADSGLPTYRGVGGLYGDAHLTRHGHAIEEVLSGPMMRRHPEVTWEYLIELEQACRGVSPNQAHRVIAAMEDQFAAVWVLTQNVDGLHRHAGSRQVIDIHGDLHVLICTRCDYREEVEDFSDLDVPLCPRCAAVVRPDVVLFGEELPAEKLAVLERELDRGFDLVFSVGTSSVFPYIAAPVLRARRAGIPTVEINPGRSEVSDVVDLRIAAGAALALGTLWKRYLAREDRG